MMRFGWMSHHVEGIRPLIGLLEAGHRFCGVVTLDDATLDGKSGVADYDSICREWNIPLYKISNVNAPESLSILKSLDLDVLYVIGWSQILRQDVLNCAKIGCFGAHASLLPENRGSAPINWSLIKGEIQTGNTLMMLSTKLDAGDIVSQRTIEITPFDTVQSLYDKVALTNLEMLERLTAELEQGILNTKSQHVDGSDLLPRRRPEHGVVDWRWPAPKLYNFVRALTRPYPGAFSIIDGSRYRIWRTALLPIKGALGAPGSVLGPIYSDTRDACGLMVACGEGAIAILELEDDQGIVYIGPDLASSGLNGIWEAARNELDVF